ncbi:MAG TPA: hypothetical protein VFZ09_20030 [Archangium sp.]|uniref:hypothetical protein n=1 Tax=Archangium sp. TaxID=1872627 RepID=UPI002E361C88|nr:hypothetical protein [Archangium sp.]HEX5748539.1 hypothetical protein [Archangium sp.]
MLRITKAQLDGMILHDERGFIDFVARHIQEESPELVLGLPFDSLRDMVAAGLDRARGHGLRTPENLTAFVSIMFEIAPNFDEHPAIARVLGDSSIPIDERMDALFTKLPPSAWEQAERSYDPAAWYSESRNLHLS